MLDFEAIHHRYTQLSPHLDERGRRMFAAAGTIGRGLKELAAAGLEGDRIRRHGGGRKALLVSDAKLLDDLLTLVAPSERGDPMSPLRWTCKSLRRLAAELRALGHRISHTVVGEVLK